MRFMKRITYIFGILIITFFIIVLIPTNNSKDNAIEVNGIVKSISEGGIKDLVFELKNDKITYYINRGLENGFDLKKAKANYLGKRATIHYIKSWTMLAPFGKTSENISQIAIDGKQIFSEW